MNLEYYKNKKEEIEKIIKNNNNKINELNNKLKLLTYTNFEEKVIATIMSSTFINFILTLILCFNIDIVLMLPSLIQIIPLSPALIITYSFISSHLIANLIDSVKHKNVSKSKKIGEKLEERYSHEIEILKIKNKNLSYKKTFKTLYINNKDIIHDNDITTKENIQDMKNYLDILFKKLDNLTTKLYLNNKLTEVKDQKFIIITKSFFFGLLIMLLSSLSTLILNIAVGTSLFPTAGIGISGIIASILHFFGSIKENISKRKVLTRINNQLNYNELSDNIDLESKIKNTIDDIYILQIILYEKEKKSLEMDEQTLESETVNNSLNKEQLIENNSISKNENVNQSRPKLVKVIKHNL